MNKLLLITFLFCFISCSIEKNESLIIKQTKKSLMTRSPSSKKTSGFLPNSFRSKFVQSFKSSLTGKLVKSRGEIVYKYPKMIKMEILNPEPSIFTSNAKKSWYYTPPFMEGEKGEVTIQTSRDTLLSGFFDTLKKGIKSNNLYQVKNLSKNKVELSFDKKTAKKIGLKKANLIFKNLDKSNLKNVDSIQLVYTDKRTVTILFENLVINIPLKPSEFVFKIPLKTNISQ
jgi:outer membrane lipoprotein-sorting protein